MMTSAQLQVAVRILKEKNVLMPWKFVRIIPSHAPYTYGQLWSEVSGNIYDTDTLPGSGIKCRNYEVKGVSACSQMTSPENIAVDADTDLLDIVNTFGMRYFSITIEHAPSCETCQATTADPPRNAFQVLMAASRRAQEADVPRLVTDASTGKDKLWNALLGFFEEKGCQFPSSCGKGGSAFVSRLVDILFYLDGHYGKIDQDLNAAVKTPSVFKSRFSGFNCPEKYKHRKRALNNLAESKLADHVTHVREAMQAQPYLDKMPWIAVKLEIVALTEVIDQYCARLKGRNARVRISQETPRSELETQTNVTTLPQQRGPVSPVLNSLDNHANEASLYVPISVHDYLPASDRRRFYDMVELLKRDGLISQCVHYVHHKGGNQRSLHFVWRVDGEAPTGDVIGKCVDVIAKISSDAGIYERRATKRDFKEAFSFLSTPVALRAIFRELTGDNSAPATLKESEIDQRFLHAMICEDAGILVDLRHQPPDRRNDTFREFFAETERYPSEDIGVACHERRHGEQLYLAKAVSIHDLHTRVKERVPPGTSVPSEKWLPYQFQPINPRANTAKYFKGSMNIKMVQKRQVRVNHVDAHYCAAAWRYLRELAIAHRDVATLVSMDDKHKVKAGEPSYPLAAAERGKKVIVGANQTMAVGDHDYSKCTLTPSVNLVIDIPVDIQGSFYRGDVYIGFKNSVVQPSSAMRHATELEGILKSRGEIPPVLLIYTDGGPDHRCNYMSVKLSMIALFRSLDLDMLIALRTAPSNSWANPVERIMSIVNTGLQGVGVMRSKMSDEFEQTIANANTVKEMREKVCTDDLKRELGESLQMPLDLLRAQMERLSLKEKPFQTFHPATEGDMGTLWQNCLEIDEALTLGVTTKDVEKLETMKEFFQHCCTQSHYCFQVKKCGEEDCTICGPLRDERCKEVRPLPFPVPAGDGHYKSFKDVYGTVTQEERPSQQGRPRAARKTIGFSPSVQHARNTDMMVQCTECSKWRLVFSKKKLGKSQKRQLTELLEDTDFTCGFQFDDINLPHGLQVFVKDHDCADHVERLYYACGYEPCCISCGEYLHGADEEDDLYPQCQDCDRVPIRKR